MNYSAVIFDMDGVLIDSEPLHQKVGLKMLRDLNIPINREMFLRFTGTTVLSMWKILLKENNLKQNPVELAAEYNRQIIEKLKVSSDVKLMDGVRDVLKNLKSKKIPVALASSSNKELIDEMLHKFSIEEYFDVIVSGSDVKHSKPHPEIFLMAAKRLGISPSKCIVVEDSTNGTIAAKHAGMFCIGYKPKQNLHELPDASLIIKSFKEFETLVLKVN